MLRIKAAECKYKEYNILITEQFINGLNDDWICDKILKEVAMLEDIEDTKSECVLLWEYKVEVQRAQKSSLNEIEQRF